MNPRLRQVIDEVLGQVVPSPEEEENIRAATELVRALIVDEVNRAGLDIALEVGGSVAKNTWLRRDVDIDLFILFPTGISKKELGELGLAIAKKAFSGYKHRERYAEHAYLEAWIGDIRVNIVPCYRTNRGKWLSAADRSPHHTRYVVEKLKVEHLNDDIRLFKKFAKGIDVYGAEIRVGGLSGYLCELLVLHYGSFPRALKTIAKWRFGEVIDPEKLYKGRDEEVRRLFSEPLIVIDPVDQNRNVAAALSRNRMAELIAATRFFLEKPSKAFFYPEDVEASQEHLRKILSSLAYDVIAIEARTEKEVPDILWGELLKTQKALRNLLEANDFAVLQSDVWSDEVESSVIVFGLETKTLSKSERRLGPPGYTDGVAPFLEKHAAEAVAGPWVEGGRWMVGMKRRYNTAEYLLEDKLSDGGRSIGVSRGLVEALASSRLLVGAEVLNLYSKEGFPRFLTRFLEGGPRWLPRHSSS